MQAIQASGKNSIEDQTKFNTLYERSLKLHSKYLELKSKEDVAAAKAVATQSNVIGNWQDLNTQANGNRIANLPVNSNNPVFQTAHQNIASMQLRQQGQELQNIINPFGVNIGGSDNNLPSKFNPNQKVKNFHGIVNGQTPQQRAYNFGHYCMAMLYAKDPMQFPFAKSFNYITNRMALDHTSSNQTGVSYLIPEEFGTDLIYNVEQYGVARKLFRNIPMASGTKTEPIVNSLTSATFVSEATNSSSTAKTNIAVGQVKLVAKEVMALSVISNPADADSAISIGDLLIQDFARAFANLEDSCAFLGDGTSTYGGIIGLVTKIRSFDNNGTDSIGVVAGAGNLWSELTLTNFNTMIGRLPQYADNQNTVWLCHKTFWATVLQPLILAAGGSTGMERVTGVGGGVQKQFLGYPVEISQVMPSTEANSQIPIMLGDFSMAAMFGDRQMLSTQFSSEATIGSLNLFEANAIAMRAIERIDIVVHSPGNASDAGAYVALETASS